MNKFTELNSNEIDTVSGGCGGGYYYAVALISFSVGTCIYINKFMNDINNMIEEINELGEKAMKYAEAIDELTSLARKENFPLEAKFIMIAARFKLLTT